MELIWDLGGKQKEVGGRRGGGTHGAAPGQSPAAFSPSMGLDPSQLSAPLTPPSSSLPFSPLSLFLPLYFLCCKLFILPPAAGNARRHSFTTTQGRGLAPWLLLEVGPGLVWSWGLWPGWMDPPCSHSHELCRLLWASAPCLAAWAMPRMCCMASDGHRCFLRPLFPFRQPDEPVPRRAGLPCSPYPTGAASASPPSHYRSTGSVAGP